MVLNCLSTVKSVVSHICLCPVHAVVNYICIVRTELKHNELTNQVYYGLPYH